MANHDLEEQLKSRWLTLARKLGTSDDQAVAIFDDLASRYSGKYRHYHTLEHLRECFELFDQYRGLFAEPDTAELALWFHDAVLDTRKADNEEQSAALARKVLSELGVDEKIIGRVEHMILATKKHIVDENDLDTALMLDIDMAILAARPVRYKEYLDQVIREFFAEDIREKFLAARAERFLIPVMDRDRIFISNALHARFNDQARKNMAWEISLSEEARTVAKRAAETPKL